MLTEKELEDIRRKMLELEEEPPADGWRRIQPDIIPWWKRYLYWWMGGGLLLLGLLSGIMIYEQELFSDSPDTVLANQQFLDNTDLRADESRSTGNEIKPSDAATGEFITPGKGLKQQQDKQLTAGEDQPETSAIKDQAELSAPANGRNIAVIADAKGEGAVDRRQATQTRLQQKNIAEAQRTPGSSSLAEPSAPQQNAGGAPAVAGGEHQADVQGKKNPAVEPAVAGGLKIQKGVNQATAEGAVVLEDETLNDRDSRVSPPSYSADTLARPAADPLIQTNVAAGAKEKEEAGLMAAGEQEQDVKVATSLNAEEHSGEGNIAEKSGVTPLAVAIATKGAEEKPAAELFIAAKDKQQVLEESAGRERAAAEYLPAIAPLGYQFDTAGAYFIADAVLVAADSIPEQEEMPVVPEKDKKQLREWSLGVFFSPRYAYRAYKPNGEDEILITRINNENISAKDRMGYEFGFSAAKAVTPRLQLEIGMGFMKLKENVSYTYTAGKVDTVIRQLTSDGQLQLKPVLATSERQLESSYAYGSWRVGANYYFWHNNHRRFNITVAGGLNLLVKGTTKIYSNGELLETVEFPADDNPLEQKNYNLQLGLGYNRSLFRNYELSLMPMVNYYMGSTYNQREPFGLRPYSLGVNLQLRRLFIR